VAYIYLSRDISLKENEVDIALEAAKAELSKLYKELEILIPPLETEINNLNQNWTVELSGFDSDLVICEDWYDGAWKASYMFEVSCKSPDGNADCDHEISAWDEWHRLDEPMYKDVFEPLYQCSWVGFKREDVLVEFTAVKAVDSYSSNEVHFYNNQGWL
jgi:hypothetical protein